MRPGSRWGISEGGACVCMLNERCSRMFQHQWKDPVKQAEFVQDRRAHCGQTF